MNRGIIIAAAALALLTGCKKASLQNAYNNQETKIESFISAQVAKADTMRVVHNQGSHRAIIAEGEGEELSSTGNVAFYYAGYVFTGSTLSNSNLFTTNSRDVAKAAGWTGEGDEYEPVTLSLKDDTMLDGLRHGLEGVRAGEECYILFSGKYAFGLKKFGTIPANSALAYHVWVESLSND